MYDDGRLLSFQFISKTGYILSLNEKGNNLAMKRRINWFFLIIIFFIFLHSSHPIPQPSSQQAISTLRREAGGRDKERDGDGDDSNDKDEGDGINKNNTQLLERDNKHTNMKHQGEKCKILICFSPVLSQNEWISHINNLK